MTDKTKTTIQIKKTTLTKLNAKRLVFAAEQGKTITMEKFLLELIKDGQI